MRKINRIVHKDIALRFLRGCGVPQFVDRVTKLVSDCLDQINEFYDVLSTVEDGKDGKNGEQGPMGPVGPAGPTGPVGPKGNDGIGVPAGGNAGQYLKKKSNSDYDTEWSDVQGGGSGNVNSVNGKTGNVVLDANDVNALPSNTPLFSGDYNDLSNKPNIPSALSQLNEDASHRVVTDVEKATWNSKSNFSGSYNDLSDKPTIPAEQVQSDWNQTNNSSKDFIKNKPNIPTVPTNVSAFTNDAGYITTAVNNLVNYYLKAELYTKSEVENLIGAIQNFHFEIYTSTSDVTSPTSNVLYLIGPTGNGSDKYEEYVYDSTKQEAWIKIGDTSVDLSGYVTTTALNTALADYTTTANLTILLSDKQDTLISGTNVKTINNQSILGSGNITIQGGGSSIQSDWNQTDTEADDYIKNKPTIPTVPTNVSAFNNDAGYLTQHQSLSNYVQKSQTAGLIKNDGTIDTNTYLTQHQDISGKADKSEMSVTDGTGADADKTTITLKNGTSATVLKSHQDISGKQDTLVSGTNIKTLNGESILGSGNINIDISGKEDKTAIEAPVNQTDATLPITTLATEVGKYYRIDIPVDTLAVTLPVMENITTTKTVVLYLTAGTTPAVTIATADSKDVYYQDGFYIEASNTYEINALFNGSAWIVASVKINTSNS